MPRQTPLGSLMARICPSAQLPGPGWAPSGESPAAPALETLTGREAHPTPHPLSLHPPHPSSPPGPQILVLCFIQKGTMGALNVAIPWQDQALEGRPSSLI